VREQGPHLILVEAMSNIDESSQKPVLRRGAIDRAAGGRHSKTCLSPLFGSRRQDPSLGHCNALTNVGKRKNRSRAIPIIHLSGRWRRLRGGMPRACHPRPNDREGPSAAAGVPLRSHAGSLGRLRITSHRKPPNITGERRRGRRIVMSHYFGYRGFVTGESEFVPQGEHFGGRSRPCGRLARAPRASPSAGSRAASISNRLCQNIISITSYAVRTRPA
jgi:hypothetical protein